MRDVDDAAGNLAAVEREGREHAFVRLATLEQHIAFDPFEGDAVAGRMRQVDDHGSDPLQQPAVAATS